jgi:hypothetical protein
MGFTSTFTRILKLFGFAAVPLANGAVYDSDGLISIHDHDFLNDPDFQAAYSRGISAAGDYKWHWRIHIGLWAAATAVKLEGDFVECGVNRGFMSSAIMKRLNWDSTGKTFYLLDTFEGINTHERSDDEEDRRNRKQLDDGFYVTDLKSVKRNFAEWENVKIIQGTVPETLGMIAAEKIAFLHLDMNAAAPEVAAFEYLWERISIGGIVLLDDYAYHGYSKQKLAMDRAAKDRDVPIASLPTGQGLIVKTGS